MRFAWALMVLVGIAFWAERIQPSLFEMYGTQTAFEPENTAPTPMSDLPLERVAAWIEKAGVAFNKAGLDKQKVTRRVALALAEFGARPSAVLARALTTQPSDQMSDDDLIERALLAQNALNTLAQQAHEHRVRHFLIHDWPGPGMAATSGAYHGTSGTAAAESYNVILASAPGTVENDGANTQQLGVPNVPVFDGITCDFSDLGGPECSEVEDIVGRVPLDYAPLSPASLATANLASGLGQANGSILSGGGSQAPLAAGGSQASLGSGGGDTPVGSGGGFVPVDDTDNGPGGVSFAAAFSEDDTTLPPAVPLPGALAFALAGLGALALFRRKTPG